jgi:hypothetical protein
MFKYYKRNAVARELEWCLSKEEFKEIVLRACTYCGSEPIERTFCWGVGKRVSLEKVNGIDRSDSSKGYLVDNCVSCCSTCNTMKMAQSVDEFISRVEKIAKWLGLK